MKPRDRNKGGNGIGAPPDDEGEHPNAPTKRQVQGNIEVRGTVQTNLPTDLIDVYRTTTRQAETRDDKSFRLQLATLLVSGLGALLTLLLAIAALRGNDIARMSLVSTQRAYITIKEIRSTRLLSLSHQESPSVSFNAVWENSGSTPAPNGVSYFSTSPNVASLTEDRFLPSGPLPLVASGGPTAAKGTDPTPPVIISEASIMGPVLNAVLQPGFDLNNQPILWGWTAYRDIFEHSSTRLTEFCDFVTESKDDAGTFHFQFTRCSIHNCQDELCPDYRSVAQKAEDVWKRQSAE